MMYHHESVTWMKGSINIRHGVNNESSWVIMSHYESWYYVYTQYIIVREIYNFYNICIYTYCIVCSSSKHVYYIN